MSLLIGSSYSLSAGRGGLGRVVNWFIRVLIYDMIVTGISDALGVSRMVALLIFLGILLAVSFGIYVVKQRSTPHADAG